MINIKPTIKAALDAVSTNVNDTYPADWATFPVIQYIEEDNSTWEKTDNTEQKAYIRYKIDIWNKASTSAAALAVDNAIAGLGFVRTLSVDTPDPSGLKHKVMRYEAVIDVNDMYVYNP